MSNNYPHPGPQQGYVSPNQQGQIDPDPQYGAPASNGQFGAPAASGYAPVSPQGGQVPGGQFGAPAASGYAPVSPQGGQVPGGQFGAPAASGYAPVSPQGGQVPGGQFGAPAASSYAPAPQPEVDTGKASESTAVVQPSSDPRIGASDATSQRETDVPQPDSVPIPQPQAASPYAPSSAATQQSSTDGASASAQLPAPDPMTRFEPEAQFTSSFQSFVNSAPAMPGPSAAQYPQAAPQQVQSWAMPTAVKKAPVFEAVVIGAGAALMLVGVSGFLLASGPFLAFFLSICCLVPLAIIVAFLQFVDRFEPEPWWTKIAALLWGGGMAVFFAQISNTLAGSIVAGATGSGDIGEIFAVVVGAPVGEEFFKALGVLAIVLLRRNSISSPLDGLVYAGYSAAGFLVVEDFTYFVSSASQGFLAHTFFVRVVMGVFGHVMYTTCTGWAIGWAVTRTRSVGTGIGVIALGYLIGVTMHGVWNGTAVLTGRGLAFYFVYFILQMPLFCCWLYFVSRTMRRERRDIAAGLMPYVNQGWILPSEVQMVCDPGARRSALSWVTSGGPAAKGAMKSFMNNLASVGLDQVVMYVRGPEKIRIEETQQKIQEATTQRLTFQSLMGIRPM